MPWQRRIFAFASENHQQYNAQSLVDCGAAKMILDQALSGETLYSALEPLVEENDYRILMAEKAAQAGNRDALNKIIELLKPYLNQ